MKKLKNWFHTLTMTGKVTVVAITALLVFGAIGVAAQSGVNNPTTHQTTQSISTKPKVEVRSVTTTEAIPFASSTVNDSTLAQGKTQVKTVGANGVLTHTYQVTYTNGTETSRTRPTDTITTPAINQVTDIGTYVTPAQNCPNGSYVNSVGNSVCSPYTSSSAPAGASAQCYDGSYSFSQSRRGTCSHHGGVATWL